MNSRPTPETDDAQWGTGKVTTDFARRLERERDEAREDLKITQEAWVKAKAERVKALRERDEAREQWKQQNEALITLALHGDAEIQRLTKERDEAREDAAHWKTEYEIVEARLCGKKHPRDNGIISEHEIIPKLTQERNEAREEVDYYREKHDLTPMSWNV